MNQHFAYVRRDATQAPAPAVLLPSAMMEALRAVARNPEEVENLRPVLRGHGNAYSAYLPRGIEYGVFSDEAQYLIRLVQTRKITRESVDSLMTILAHMSGELSDLMDEGY